MDLTFTALIGVIAATLVALAGFTKNYLERKEQFDFTKYALTCAIGVCVAFAAYFTTGQIPDSSTILTQLMSVTGLTAVVNPLAIVTGRKVETYVTSPTREVVDPGLCVVPTFTEGVSPLEVEFTISASPVSGPSRVERFCFEFGDGVIQSGSLTNGIAVVKHTYVYIPEPKYTGKTYYPNCRITLATGETEELNAQPGRYAVSVTVHKPEG